MKLRPFGPADFDWLIGQIETPHLMMLWSGAAFDFPLDRAQLQRHMFNTRRENPKFRYYAACLETGELAGYGEISRISRNRSAYITRILVRSDLRGRGVGCELVRELLRIGFEEFRLHRIELRVFESNAPAIACYEKAGFVREGLLRDVFLADCEFWSEYRMAVLESAWEAQGGSRLPPAPSAG